MLIYNPVYFIVFGPVIRRSLVKRFGYWNSAAMIKRAKREYKILLKEAPSIGSFSKMAVNLYFSLIFVALHVANKDRITKEVLEKIIDEGLKDEKMKKHIGDINLNNPSDMEEFRLSLEKNARWERKNRKKYPMTWDFHFDDKKHEDGIYYHFTICPIASFLKEKKLSYLTELFCNLDFI